MTTKYGTAALVAALMLAGCGGDDGQPNNMPAAVAPASFTAVDSTKIASKATIQGWLLAKDSWGPTYTGGPGWQKYQAWVDTSIAAIPGVTGVVKYEFPMTLWQTTEFPDKTNWSLVSNGTAVNVAAYGTQSGTTGATGVTAPMVLYDLNLPVAQRPTVASMAGKIIVVNQQPYSTILSRVPLGVSAPTTASTYCSNPPVCAALPNDETNNGFPETTNGLPGAPQGMTDYEYATNADTLPAIGQVIPVTIDTSDRNRDQFGQSLGSVLNNVIIPSGAVGVVEVMDLSPDAANGMRQHGTPSQYNVPALLLDRVAGAQVLLDAAAGKTATLKLVATETPDVPDYERFFELPGKNYGTSLDQSLLMVTHMDGPSIVEEDGGMGLIAVAQYYAQIPQSQRPKTIKFFLDTRHFVAGTEFSYPFDYLDDNPSAGATVVGGVMMEHLGGIGYVENGNSYVSSGLPARNFIWGWPNPLAITKAVNAVNTQGMIRAQVLAPAELGVHGGVQKGWLGPSFGQHLTALGGWPGWHVSGDWPSAGSQAFYPQQLTRVDPGYFQTQLAVAIELMNDLMVGDTIALNPDWGYLKQSIVSLTSASFATPANSTTGEATLTTDFNNVFGQVTSGNYSQALTALATLQTDANALLTPAAATAVGAWQARCVARANTAITWKAQGLM